MIRDIFESAEQIADEIPVAFIENYDMHTGLMMTVVLIFGSTIQFVQWKRLEHLE